MKKIVVLTAMLISATFAHAADNTFPNELVGKYAPKHMSCKDAVQAEKATETWMGIVIKSKQSENEMEICKPLKVSTSERGFLIEEKCENMDQKYKQKLEFQISGKDLTVKNGKAENKYVKCSN